MRKIKKNNMAALKVQCRKKTPLKKKRQLLGIHVVIAQCVIQLKLRRGLSIERLLSSVIFASNLV